MTRLVNRSQFVSPGKVRQGHMKSRNFATEGHRRWSRGRCRVRVCSSRSGRRQSGAVNVAAIKGSGFVAHTFLHREGQRGRTSATEQR
ncbi:hypothetical protein Q1695_000171 [Nippostrongylus brasiliensis]|nr:hypothetical protein Q1695_000171 [Nippostrongylus brasiliensis]